MSARASVAVVKRVPAGSGVSYGHLYTTPTDTVLGLVPLGYADGIPRIATNTVFLSKEHPSHVVLPVSGPQVNGQGNPRLAGNMAAGKP